MFNERSPLEEFLHNLGLKGIGDIPEAKRPLVRGAVMAARNDRTRTRMEKARAIADLFRVDAGAVEALLR